MTGHLPSRTPVPLKTTVAEICVCKGQSCDLELKWRYSVMIIWLEFRVMVTVKILG